MDNSRSGFLIDLILASIVENLLEGELPDIGLIVDHSVCLILVLLQRDCTLRKINFDIFTGEVGRGPRSDHHLHGLLVRHY